MGSYSKQKLRKSLALGLAGLAPQVAAIGAISAETAWASVVSAGRVTALCWRWST